MAKKDDRMAVLPAPLYMKKQSSRTRHMFHPHMDPYQDEPYFDLPNLARDYEPVVPFAPPDVPQPMPRTHREAHPVEDHAPPRHYATPHARHTQMLLFGHDQGDFVYEPEEEHDQAHIPDHTEVHDYADLPLPEHPDQLAFPND